MFLETFRKHGLVPLATYRQIYEKGDIVDIKRIDTLEKGLPHKCSHGRTGGVYSVTQHTIGVVVNKKLRARFFLLLLLPLLFISSIKLRARFLARRINALTENIKYSKS